MPKAPFETSPQHRPGESASFFDAAASRLDWSRVAAHVGAIEARLGMRVCIPLLRLGLIAYWLQLDAQEVEDACRKREELLRFVSSTVGHPAVDIWVYQQLAPRLQAADAEFASLGDAIEDELAALGWSLEVSGYRSADVPDADEDWAQTTLVAADGLAAWGAAGERVPLHSADALELPSRSTESRALVLWPWGDASDLDRPLAIGRDESFSTFAHRLGADRWISRRHVVLEPVRGGVMVRDAGSSNGTRADGVRIGRGESRLIDGDCTLRLGPHFGCKIVFYPNTAMG